MRVWCVSKHRLARWATAVMCIAAVGLLLRFPSAAAGGVSRGLAVCGKQLIPSLFPFLVLTNFMIKSGLAGEAAAWLARRIPLLHGRGQALTVWLLSVLGGYPTGACAVAGSVRQGLLSPSDAGPLLCCAVHAAPAFIIGGVGATMLGSTHAGLLLWTAHLLSAMVLWLLWRPMSVSSGTVHSTSMPLSRAVTDSLHEAAATLLSMAGCILTACTALSVIDALGASAITAPITRALMALPLEVCIGCLEAASCGVYAPFFLGLALGFGGLSVIGQIAAVTGEWRLVNRSFFAARLLHGLLGGCLSLLLFRIFPPPVVAVSAVTFLPSAANTDRSLAPTVLILLMAVIFLMSLPESQSRRLHFRA